MGDLVTTSCPERAVLERFARGSLAADDKALIAEHIASCEACQRTHDETDLSDDPVVASLRGYDQFRCQETGYLRLVAQLADHDPAKRAFSRSRGEKEIDPVTAQAATVLGNYHLAERIGQGGMGAVYRAQHTKLKRWVAVKILSPPRQNAPAAIQQFEQEMQILGQLEDHENIIRARDAGQSGDQHFLVMDYVDGIDAGRLLQTVGPLEVADACEIVRQAAAALDHAHQHGLIHRDVKPSNLMVTREGCVKLLDLGLASYHDAPTEDVSVAGTADYMAPEQWQSEPIGVGVDVYGLGCTLFKLLVGYAPFARGETSNLSKQRRHCTESPLPVDSVRRDIPPRLASLVATMLAKDPQQRIESAAEVARLVAPMSFGHELSTIVANALTVETETDCPGDVPTDLDSRPCLVQQAKRRRITRRMWAFAAAAAGAGAWFTWWSQQVDYQLVWAPRPREVHWQYHAFRNMLQVYATDLVLLGRSHQASSSVQLVFNVVPQARPTVAGYFFAYNVETKDGWTIRTFHTIGLSPSDEGPGLEIQLTHHRFSETPAGTLIQEPQLLATEFAHGSDSSDGSLIGGPLVVTLRDGRLQNASFKGQRLVEIEAAANAEASDAATTAGLFLSEGAATFREAASR